MKEKETEQTKARKIILSQEELMKLLDAVKHENIQSGHSYRNYADYPVVVMEKEFSPKGVIGDVRDDITDSELLVIKKSKLIQEGILGEDSDNPQDGSASDKQLTDVANKDFEQFEDIVAKTPGEITVQRLMAICLKLEKPSKYERVCLSRIGELRSMQTRQSDHVDSNIYNGPK